MKQLKKGIVWMFILLMLVCLTACANDSSIGDQSDGLDLDYIESGNAEGNTVDATPEPWYAWFADAFSFGETNKSSGSEIPLETQYAPDSVQEFYEQGAEPMESSAANRDEANETQSVETTPFVPQSTPRASQSMPSNAQSAAPVQTPVPTQTPLGNTVAMSIRCDTAVANGMHIESKWAGIVPASGIILDTTTFEIEDGDTVLDVLLQARDLYRLHVDYSGTKSSAYVKGINNLYEFDGGRWSGWMYCVNGWYPNYGCGVYFLKAGDAIEWNYTCDLGLDLDSNWWDGAQEWKDTHE